MMQTELVAIKAVNNFLSGDDRSNKRKPLPKSDRFFEVYLHQVSPAHLLPSHGLLPWQRAPRIYLPQESEGEVIDVEMPSAALASLDSQDALITYSLATCLGVGMKVREVKKSWHGLRSKELPDRDYFVLAHFTYPFLGFNDLIGLVMKRFRVLGIAISATPQVLPSIENVLKLPHLKLQGLRPLVKVMDKKDSWVETSGMVVTKEGGAFMRAQDGEYVLNASWSWDN